MLYTLSLPKNGQFRKPIFPDIRYKFMKDFITRFIRSFDYKSGIFRIIIQMAWNRFLYYSKNGPLEYSDADFHVFEYLFKRTYSNIVRFQ